MSRLHQSDSLGLRVALISGSYPDIKCGIGDFTGQLANALTDRADEVHVITSEGAAQPHDGKVKVHATVSAWTRRSLSTILQTLRVIKPHIVNIQYPTQQYGRHLAVNVLPWVINKRLQIPTVVTIHEFSSFTNFGRSRLAITAMLGQAVIVTNEVDKSLLHKWIGNTPPAGLVPIGSSIPNSPSPGYQRSEQRERLGVNPTTIVLAFFGLISPSKGLDTLLDAFTFACSQSPDLDLKLWILADHKSSAPGYDAYHSAFVKHLTNLPHRDRVFWSGYLTPPILTDHLLAADIAVLPFDDGASLRRSSLLAMLGHGLPVISTHEQNTLNNELNESRGICLVPPGNAHELATVILQLATNTERCATVGRNAQAFSQQFNWPGIAEQTNDVYLQLVPAVYRKIQSERTMQRSHKGDNSQ